MSLFELLQDPVEGKAFMACLGQPSSVEARVAYAAVLDGIADPRGELLRLEVLLQDPAPGSDYAVERARLDVLVSQVSEMWWDAVRLSHPIHNCGQPGEGSFDDGEQSVLQPVLGISTLDSDDEGAIFVFQQPGIAQPGVEGGLRHLKLKFAECGRPDVVRFHCRLCGQRLIGGEKRRGIGKVDSSTRMGLPGPFTLPAEVAV